jgi:hypothetical protein
MLVDEYLAMNFSLGQAIALAAQDSVQQDLDVIEPDVFAGQ